MFETRSDVLKFFGGSISLEFDTLTNYTGQLDALLRKQLQEFSTEMDRRAAALPEEQRADFYEWHADEHEELSRAFPQYLYRGVLIAAYSQVESTLVGMARFMERHFQATVLLADLRGDGIQRAKSYLVKLHGIVFPEPSQPWTRLNDYRRVRNFIVHNESILDNSQNAQSVRQFAQQNPTMISIGHLDQIIVHPAGCLDVIATGRAFFDELVRTN